MARMTDLKITFTTWVSVSKSISDIDVEGRMQNIMEVLERRVIDSVEETMQEHGGVFHAAKSEYEIEN